MAQTDFGKKLTKLIKSGEKVAKAAKEFKAVLEDLKPPDQPAQS